MKFLSGFAGVLFVGAVIGWSAVRGGASDAANPVDGVASTAAGDRPVSPADLEAAAAAARSAVAGIADADREASASGAVPVDWKKLDRQLQDPKTADVATLRSLGRAIASQSHGFEPPKYRGSARAVQRYANMLEASKADLEKRVGDLNEVLALSGTDRFGRLADAGSILEKLQDTGHAPQAVAGALAAIGKPNLFVDVHERLLDESVGRPIDEVAPVDEVILGIRQRGMGHTHGYVRPDFVPSTDNAVLDIVLDAVNHADTRGGRGPVTVCSRGTTSLGARRRILIDDEAIHPLSPEARASAHSETAGIGVRAHLGRNLIRRVASRRAEQMRPQADAIAAGRAQERLFSRFQSQTQGPVEDMVVNYQTRFREPLIEHLLYPEMLHLNTTDLRLHSAGRKMALGEVGAASPPPPPVESAVLSARVHQTAIENAANVWLSGRTFTRDEVEEEYRRRGEPLPEALRDEDEEKGGEPRPWSVRLAAEKPLSLDVEDDRVVATIRGDAFYSVNKNNEEVERGPRIIKVAYKIERGPDGVKLRRDGDIDIEFPEDDGKDRGFSPRKGVEERQFRRRLERVLRETIEVEPLELPGQLASAGPLPIEHLSSRNDGWITAGWREKDRAVEVVPAPATEVRVTSITSTDR